MSANRFQDWANRRASHGGRVNQPQQQHRQEISNTAPAIPPPGYAWLMHPQHGMVLVPLSQTAPVIPTPIRQAQHMTMPQTVAQNFAPSYSPSIQTCTLVKPGNRDTYAELLQTIPDLVPPSGFDAMTGNISPLTAQELQGCAEFSQMSFQQDAPIAFSRGAVLVQNVSDLGVK